jgi:hypothetical protein
MNHNPKKPSLNVNPNAICGLVLLDLCARFVDSGKNSNKVYHVIVTLDSDCGLNVYGAYGRQGQSLRVHAYETGIKPSATGLSIAIAKIMDDKIRHGYQITYFEHCLYQVPKHAKLKEFAKEMGHFQRNFDSKSYLEPGIGQPQTWLPEQIDVPFPLDYLDFSEDYAQPATKTVARPRLSKEDWLKQNYPELSELPKWRFPASQ